VCVIVWPASSGRLAETARWLGADGTLAEKLAQSPHRRPAAYVDGERISIVGFATNEPGDPAEVHLHVGKRGLLVLCPDTAAGTVSGLVVSGGVIGLPYYRHTNPAMITARTGIQAVLADTN
jgi:hypothetical protein